ncbi:DUF932 domain-containing protein [Nitrospirillum amazonense]|uniref:DUF932 domain-containing protein n=1 Tax=Nitrospirillum amazonense TaxID=28077 RepID=UPI002412B862|nr:DUF932 domain-containing protein [Nitrospirillum amazonense]MDG3443707.1 DUF932 domain-containing protein [Nitrospirillum amazonense]
MFAPIIENPAAGYKVDPFQGKRDGAVSSQWFSRPSDQRYLSLDALYNTVLMRSQFSKQRTMETRDIRVNAGRENAEKMTLILPGDEEVRPNHWSFGQLASLIGAPAGYLRNLPAFLAGINMQHGLINHRAEMIKTYATGNGAMELRAATSPEYGRIYDHELVKAIMTFAGNGAGDSRWRVPGQIDWSTLIYRPHCGEITKETTTLYLSDRDVFIFLVDDLNPIEAGTLPDGQPDIYFRGFYAWNSEVGKTTMGIRTFYLRGVCQNRNLWGVEGVQELTIRHSKHAASRFMFEAAPALSEFANSSPKGFIDGINAAKAQIVAKDEDDRLNFLKRNGFSKKAAKSILDTVLAEEGHEASSVYDFVQGITAVARGDGHQDQRIELEEKAASMMRRVTR